ncbi:hypothetical protein EDB86DRAFT_1423859 [Lactarius hatsudake]|nr:hypothetical protein EDB86DRAFT_1423859 [Lactarius hatsudake]
MPSVYTSRIYFFFHNRWHCNGKRFSAHQIHKLFFLGKRTEAAMGWCPYYSSINLASPPNDTRVSESDACLLVLFFYNSVPLSRMWCGQLVDYVEDIRDTVQILVHITTVVLEHNVVGAHARRVQRCSNPYCICSCWPIRPAFRGLRDQYQMFGARKAYDQVQPSSRIYLCTRSVRDQCMDSKLIRELFTVQYTYEETKSDRNRYSKDHHKRTQKK